MIINKLPTCASQLPRIPLHSFPPNNQTDKQTNKPEKNKQKINQMSKQTR